MKSRPALAKSIFEGLTSESNPKDLAQARLWVRNFFRRIRVVTHKELISAAWPTVTVEKGNLRFQMATLRKALGDGRDGARYVSNVAGRGYCFVASVTRSGAAKQSPDPSEPRCIAHRTFQHEAACAG
jgi:DNA-binding winged helix-turn-helix (wHTH) protein